MEHNVKIKSAIPGLTDQTSVQLSDSAKKDQRNQQYAGHQTSMSGSDDPAVKH